VAINNFELESLSFTEQNIVNRNQMKPSWSSLHFGRNSVLSFISLFPRSGRGRLVHLVLL